MTTHSFDRGPYLLAALLCERVLEEKDGGKSAIRIIDRVTRTVMGPRPPETMEPFDYQATLLVRLKSGFTARGPHTLKIRLVKPSQETSPPLQHMIYFEGEEDRGVDVVVNMTLRLDMPGLYWFQLSLNEIQLTRIPLRVIYLPQPIQTGEPGAGPPPSGPLPTK